jgi:TRAP-type uncharacterized transport system substrate-binding protein
MTFLSKLAAVTALMLGFTASAQAQTAGKTPLTICVGGPAGIYATVVGKDLQEQLAESFTVTVVNTNGSPEILGKIEKGECHIGPAQLDAFVQTITAKVSLSQY